MSFDLWTRYAYTASPLRQVSVEQMFAMFTDSMISTSPDGRPSKVIVVGDKIAEAGKFMATQRARRMSWRRVKKALKQRGLR